MAQINFVNSANAIIEAFFGGRREYYNTPKPTGDSVIMMGEPEFLNPETWNAHNIYMTTPQLYSVINRRGYMLASGVWKHYQAKGDGQVEEIVDSPLVKLLENPNPLMNGNDHIRQLNENKCVFGNNYEYILKAFDSDEIPSGLTNISPTAVAIKTTGQYYKQTSIEDIIEYYEIREANKVLDRLAPSEINHTKTVNGVNAIKGESPMTPIHMPISNIRAAYQFRNVIMTKRGAIGILSTDKKDASGAIPLTMQERQRIEEAYKRSYGIGDKQIQAIMTSVNLRWQAMSYPTKDLMLFEEVDADFRTIIDQYGLNDNIFSREKGSTFTNMAEGMEQAYQSTIIPEAEELAMNKSQKYGLIERGQFLELDYSHIPVLQENQTEKADALSKKADAVLKLQQSLIYSNDEIREIVQF
jgi:phage portal protein BeeE